MQKLQPPYLSQVTEIKGTMHVQLAIMHSVLTLRTTRETSQICTADAAPHRYILDANSYDGISTNVLHEAHLALLNTRYCEFVLLRHVSNAQSEYKHPASQSSTLPSAHSVKLLRV
jgi:hypothetical protein